MTLELGGNHELCCLQARTNPSRTGDGHIGTGGALASGQSLTIVVFKRVPAEVCENCGEYYLSDEVTGELLEQAEKAITSGAEVEIRRYAA